MLPSRNQPDPLATGTGTWLNTGFMAVLGTDFNSCGFCHSPANVLGDLIVTLSLFSPTD